MSHQPVCVSCGVSMKVDLTGVTFLEMTEQGYATEPVPYRVWRSDRWICPKCGQKVLTGFGHEAYAYSYEPDFNAQVQEALQNPETVLERR